MKRLLCIPLVLSMGMVWGCGSSDSTEGYFDRDDLNQQCDFLMATVRNNDELLTCEVALTECTDLEMSELVSKWSCDLGETTENCEVDEQGELIMWSPALTPECQEAVDTITPEENGFWDAVNAILYVPRSILNGALAGTEWCGPGDLTTDTETPTSTLDASCRRHDHGNNYSTQPWYLLGLPNAYCRVDADIVNGANGSSRDGSISQSDHDNGKSMINFVFGPGSWYYCGSNVQVRHCNWGCHGWSGCYCSYSYSTERQDFWRGDKNHYMVHGTEPGYADGCTHNNKDQGC
jgi:hypothetical protein